MLGLAGFCIRISSGLFIMALSHLRSYREADTTYSMKKLSIQLFDFGSGKVKIKPESLLKYLSL
jgi:hypothetical protein